MDERVRAMTPAAASWHMAAMQRSAAPTLSVVSAAAMQGYPQPEPEPEPEQAQEQGV